MADNWLKVIDEISKNKKEKDEAIRQELDSRPLVALYSRSNDSEYEIGIWSGDKCVVTCGRYKGRRWQVDTLTHYTFDFVRALMRAVPAEETSNDKD